ncbi:serine/threonine-protein kinase [Pseudonocardia xishanensis]|uniref:non-specific serine/threonine protein kinase n=1 Tax=Pseudonocardia xishanensis TaxID=630995 RepID=A0ABP8RRN6_9PSEU
MTAGGPGGRAGSVPGGLAAGGRIAGRYELERRIAVGGMGEVWEAVDERLGRNVAVKVLRAELSDDDEFLHRFRIEARTVASLNHSGVAAIHDYGEDEVSADGRRTAYLVMELVRGEPLSAVIARGPLEPAETLRIMEQAAHSLYAAHERGFVHRDVKPGNILIRVDGTVKLTDFGIAKAANAVPVTRTGMVMGTAHYIAPEQASGGEAGPEGDVYSLGIVGYECLAGHRPFRAENAVAVAMMQVRDAPPPLPNTVPPKIRQLIETILVKDPAQRYADGAELAAAVAAIRRDLAVPTPARMAAQGLRLPGTEDSAEPEPGPTGHRRSRRERRRKGRSDSRGTARTTTPGSGSGASPVAASGAPGAAAPATEAPETGPRPGGPGTGGSAATGPRTGGTGPRPETDSGRSARTARPRTGPSAAAPSTPVDGSPERGGPAPRVPDGAGPGGTPSGGSAGPSSPGGTGPGGTAPGGTGSRRGLVSDPNGPDRPPRPVRPAFHDAPPAPPTEPLRLVAKPARSTGGTALLVAFVLLIVAAIVVAALTVPRLFGDRPATTDTVTTTTPTPAAAALEPAPESAAHPGAAAGTVTRRMVVLARSAEPGEPDGRMITIDNTPHTTEEVR